MKKKKMKSVAVADFIKYYPELEEAYGSFNAKKLTEYAVSQQNKKRPKMFSIITSIKSNPEANLPIAFQSKLPALTERQKEMVGIKDNINISPMFRIYNDEDYDYVEDEKEDVDQMNKPRYEHRLRSHYSPIPDEEFHTVPDIPEFEDDFYDNDEYATRRRHLNEVKRELIDILTPTDVSRETLYSRQPRDIDSHRRRHSGINVSFDTRERRNRRPTRHTTRRRRNVINLDINPYDDYDDDF